MRFDLLLVLALILIGCGSGPPPASDVVRTDSAGVAIVLNPGEDRPLEWTFEPVLTLGGADEGPASFYQIWSGALAADDEGHLYILDRGNHRVVVFDSAGRHLRTLGGRGGGPGEFQMPQSLVLESDGTLAVTDIGHRGMVRLSPAGEPIEHRTIPGWTGGRIAPMPGGIVVEVQERDSDGLRTELRLFGDTGEATLVSQPVQPMRPLDLGCVRISGMPPVFAPFLNWAGNGESLAIAPGAAYDIAIYGNGRLDTMIRRDLAPRRATRALAIQQMGDGFDVGVPGGVCRGEPEDVVDQRGFAEVVPAVGQLALAPDGTLWVRRYAVRGELAPVDIFSPDGDYLGTLPAEAPFPLAFLPGGRIAALERDAFDVERVVVYRIGDD